MNNHAEGWHSKLRKLAGKAHPNIYEVVSLFKSEQAATEVTEKDLLYVWPLDKKPQDPNLPWYSAVPLGKHTLQQKMCAEAGFSGTYMYMKHGMVLHKSWRRWIISRSILIPHTQ